MYEIEFFGLNAAAWLTLMVVAGVFLSQLCTKISADYAFTGGLAVLLISGVLTRDEALEGFAAKGMITVGLLYVVVAGLQDTGALNWVAENILGRPTGWHRSMLRLMVPVTLLSSVLNNTPVVAMFIPVVQSWARRIKLSPSRLLIPLSYASILGGTCTLIGTSTNLVVYGLYEQGHDGSDFGFFEIAKLGVPCALAGFTYLLMFGKRLLPDRAAQLSSSCPREYLAEMKVPTGSKLAEKTVAEAGLRGLPSGYLIEIVRAHSIIAPVAPTEKLKKGDYLLFAGDPQCYVDLRNMGGMEELSDGTDRDELPQHDRRLVEAVVAPTCPLVGRTIRDGGFRGKYNAAVVAATRNGKRISGRLGDLVLRPGDMLLVECHAGFVERLKDSRDFYLANEVAGSKSPRSKKAPFAAIILVLMICAAAFKITGMLEASLLAALAMAALSCCSWRSAVKRVEWNVLIVIASALGLGMAMDRSGAAGALARTLVDVGGGSPWLVLLGVYLACTVLTEMITNNAAAALIYPIAIGAAKQLGVSELPFVFSLMIAASASFATPIGYQTNLMVYGPGGYRFSDFMRIGLPMNALMGIVAVALAPIIWPF